MSQKIVTVAGTQSEIALERDGARYRAGEQEIEVIELRGEEMAVRIDGKTHVIPYVVDGSTVSFAFEGEIYSADVSDKGARAKARHREQSTAAPMPGLVTKILVAQGDVVAKGAPLVILEAMKMEHQITAPRDGKVAKVNCKEGEMVQPGVELVDIDG